MKDYKDFPPINSFMRVLKSYPRSALVYLQIWKSKDKNMHYDLKKKDIRKDYLISPTLYRNLLAPLMFLNLIHFIESDEKYQIDVNGSQENE